MIRDGRLTEEQWRKYRCLLGKIPSATINPKGAYFVRLRHAGLSFEGDTGCTLRLADCGKEVPHAEQIEGSENVAVPSCAEEEFGGTTAF
jgi:hypothetical protein